MDLNKAMILGRLTNDPQNRTTQSGQNVASFGVATNRKWNDRNTGEPREETQFHNIVAWGKLAEICSNYMNKGSRVFVEGRLQTSSWDDQQSGQKRYKTEINADNIIMLDSKGQGGGGQNNYNSGGQNQNNPVQNAQPQNNQGSANNQNVDVPAAEEIPTINVDEEKGDDVKVEDIPF